MRISRAYYVLIVAAVACALSTSGCATIVASGPDPVPVNSQPSGAQIFVDGALVGTTPSTIKLARDTSGTITIEKPGFEPMTVHKSKVLNGWVFGNLCVGMLPGLLIDIATGNTKRFSKTPVTVSLTPLNASGEAAGRPVTLNMVRARK